MAELQPMPDLVVVVPGITGSVLEANGKEVWAASGRAIMNGVLSLGQSIDDLKLPEGFGDRLPESPGEGEPADGVRATKLMPDLHVIPGLWSPIKGYSALVDWFRSRFTVSAPAGGRPGNLIEFPYDWRLSNVVSARRLEATVVPALERWRETTDNPEAKLVLVSHSMGGLVARWFLEVLGGWELTTWLITVATPYQGAVNALETLVNGVSKGLWPLKKNLSGLVRSFPSLYELLPTYPCIDAGGGKMQGHSEVSGLGLNTDMVKSATRFHQRIAEEVEKRPTTAYRIVAIKGIQQPTSQSARQTDDGVQGLREHGGKDKEGDGTVPRSSSHPPEWVGGEAGGRPVYASQRHATLQETGGVHTGLFGWLTQDQMGTSMGGEQVGMDVPDLVPAGEPLVVEASAEDPTLALSATVTHHDDAVPVAPPQLLTNLGDGRYSTEFTDLGQGTYQVTVASAVPTRPVDAVAGVTIVWAAEGA